MKLQKNHVKIYKKKNTIGDYSTLSVQYKTTICEQPVAHRL